MVRFVNDIVELELSFCNNVFNWKGPIGPDKSEKNLQHFASVSHLYKI